MQEHLRKHRQIIAYVFWGGVTTVVNFITYFLMTRVLTLGLVTANIVAWAVSVLFAFWVNRGYVFHGNGNLLKELGLFVGGRAFSGAMETGLLWLLVDILHFHDMVIKVLVSILVVTLNYLFSKFIIFRKKD